MTVSIEGPAGQDWKGELRGRTELSDGSISLTVEGTDGTAICGDECQTIPVDSQSTLSATVIRVESTTGVVVPVTAISSDASGNTSVTLINGSSQDVEILASANGLAVISGIDSGERLLLIGTKASP
ncbi:hypothetical protein [Homoserinimonas hongtaonis]|uniref:hypothetical protein n=1 Tax=Homoserinimonas hongtaonis TaxID=2079791 RepID=UPI001F543551|nr:hypothetical protein [Salinibacterium hongtaonis]